MWPENLAATAVRIGPAHRRQASAPEGHDQPIKSIWVYPLTPNFQRYLRAV
jgi:hypothetical protein